MQKHEFENKVAIVTGAGRGLGKAIALALGAAGARVAVNDLNPDRAETVAAQIREAGGQALAIAADVSNKFQCVNIVESTRETWEKLDILVNHARIRPSSTILKMDEWAWQRAIDVNLKGVFFMSQLVGRVMADENQARGGVIVNIGSYAGVEAPLVDRGAYCAGMAGVAGFSRECAREYAAYNIRVNVILADEQERLEAPEESAAKVTAQVLYLCSSGATTISGQQIKII